jgi:hypothetical protein
MKKQGQKPEMLLLCSGAWGIYTGQYFYEQYRHNFIEDKIIPEWVKEAIESPDHEEYLDAWLWLEENVMIDVNGQAYYLHQEDDLWAIPEGYTWEDFAE